MADIDAFDEWSCHLYELEPTAPERTRLYLSDVAVQSADELINRAGVEYNNKLTLEQELPRGWVVETVGLLDNGQFIGDPVDLERTNVVVKPYAGTQGMNVKYFAAGELLQFMETDLRYATGEYVVTKAYEAHGYSLAVWPDASNTLRMLTYVDDKGDAHVVATVQKWGSRNSGYIDNWSKGGYSTWVSHGMLMSTVEDWSPVSERAGHGSPFEPHNSVPLRRRSHPDSGARITGTILPFWTETVRMVTEAAECIAPGVLYAGWDVIITATGPVIIEANPWPGVQLIQVHAPLLGKVRFREFLESHGVEGL